MPQANTTSVATQRKTPSGLVTKVFSADVSVTDGTREVTAKISTSAVDRDGDVLMPQGCVATEFMLNPIVYLNHNYWDVPHGIMGQCTGIRRDSEAVLAKTLFATRPVGYPDGKEWVPDTILDLIKQKVIRGFSVGFVSKESRPASDKDIAKYGAGCRRVISKWVLHEYSIAPLPCNPEAVATAVAKGLITPAIAKKVFGVEAEQKSDTGVCSKCDKEFEYSELQEVDGSWICKVCQDAAKALESDDPARPTNPPAEQESIRVIEMVDLPSAPAEEQPSKMYAHEVVDFGNRQPAQPVQPEKIVKRLVIANLAKRTGKIYVDN